ncbi:MAG: hypothetical protein WBP13_06680 [Methylophilaceae bacterium]
MKLVKLVKLVAVTAVALSLMACASAGGVSKKSFNLGNEKSQEIVGIVAPYFSINEDIIEDVCKGINNADARCLEQLKYKAVGIIAKFGYMDAAVGYTALIPKDLNINSCMTGQKTCTYVRATKKKGELATITEVVSRPGDGKCRWRGMNSAGGVVCDGIFDYRKDFIGYVIR